MLTSVLIQPETEFSDSGRRRPSRLGRLLHLIARNDESAVAVTRRMPSEQSGKWLCPPDRLTRFLAFKTLS